MATLTRKQREIRQRHELILRVARELLLERGYTGLTMDRIAAGVEYSKGTVYQHFANKEEVVIALATETANKRTSLFELAATFKGRPRERMAAIGLASDVFTSRNPNHVQSEQIARMAVREKISPTSAQKLALCESRCMGIVSGVVRDGISQGDLSLPKGVSPEHIAFGLWTMSFGTYSMHGMGVGFEAVGIPDVFAALRLSQHKLLDGYGWKPLSSEHDYDAVAERIYQEVLADHFDNEEEA